MAAYHIFPRGDFSLKLMGFAQALTCTARHLAKIPKTCGQEHATCFPEADAVQDDAAEQACCSREYRRMCFVLVSAI